MPEKNAIADMLTNLLNRLYECENMNIDSNNKHPLTPSLHHICQNDEKAMPEV